MGKPEGIIETYLKTQAEKQGFLCMKFVSPGTSGVPDRVLIGHGHTVFIETKRTGGTLRKLQEKVTENMTKHGAIVYVIDNKADIDTLLQQLQEGRNNRMGM